MAQPGLCSSCPGCLDMQSQSYSVHCCSHITCARHDRISLLPQVDVPGVGYCMAAVLSAPFGGDHTWGLHKQLNDKRRVATLPELAYLTPQLCKYFTTSSRQWADVERWDQEVRDFTPAYMREIVCNATEPVASKRWTMAEVCSKIREAGQRVVEEE